MNSVHYLRRLDTVNGILNQMSRPCRVLLLLCVMPVKRKPLEGPPFNLYKTNNRESLVISNKNIEVNIKGMDLLPDAQNCGLRMRCGLKNVPGIPGIHTTRNFTYLTRGPWVNKLQLCSKYDNIPTHYSGVIMSTMTSEITGIPIVCPIRLKNSSKLWSYCHLVLSHRYAGTAQLCKMYSQ